MDDFYFRKDSQKYRNDCKSCVNCRNGHNHVKNSEKIRAYNKTYGTKYREANKAKLAEKERKLKRNLQYRIASNLRSRIYTAIKAISKNGSAIRDPGCSVSELIVYLESLFKEGMTWDNYGRGGWHIDHILPLSSFDLSKKEHLRAACHYTNLQPMWEIDNLRKGAKIL